MTTTTAKGENVPLLGLREPKPLRKKRASRQNRILGRSSNCLPCRLAKTNRRAARGSQATWPGPINDLAQLFAAADSQLLRPGEHHHYHYHYHGWLLCPLRRSFWRWRCCRCWSAERAARISITCAAESQCTCISSRPLSKAHAKVLKFLSSLRESEQIS